MLYGLKYNDMLALHILTLFQERYPRSNPNYALQKEEHFLFFHFIAIFKNKVPTPSHPSTLPSVPTDSCHYKNVSASV